MGGKEHQQGLPAAAAAPHWSRDVWGSQLAAAAQRDRPCRCWGSGHGAAAAPCEQEGIPLHPTPHSRAGGAGGGTKPLPGSRAGAGPGRSRGGPITLLWLHSFPGLQGLQPGFPLLIRTGLVWGRVRVQGVPPGRAQGMPPGQSLDSGGAPRGRVWAQGVPPRQGLGSGGMSRQSLGSGGAPRDGVSARGVPLEQGLG